MTLQQAAERKHYKGVITDNAIWEGFELRDDDVIVDTPPKCGTTWTLNIVMMLIHGKVVPEAGNRSEAPWLDCGARDQQAMKDYLDGLTRRRCIKSHTPVDGVPFRSGPDYFFVYRHPVDMHLSFRKHIQNMTWDQLDYLMEGDVRQGFRRFITAPATSAGTDDMTIASLASHFHAARALKDAPNVHFFHYADMTHDLRGQIARMASIMGIDISDALLDALTEANTFAAMRKAAEESPDRFSSEGSMTDEAKFFDSGTSGKWSGRLTEEDMADYRARMAEFFSAEDIAWLEWGARGTP